MKRLRMVCLAVFLIAVCAGTSYAGIVQWDETWSATWTKDYLPTSSNLDEPTWTIIEEEFLSGIITVVVDEGFANEDPIINVVKTVTNGSCFDWTGYQVEISGSEGVSYVPDSAYSSVFNDISEEGGILTFFNGIVSIGGMADIQFQVEIPCGLFDFSMTQTPIPEPATIGLLSIGMLFLRSRSISKRKEAERL